MYKQLSRYPKIKRDITIQTANSIPFIKIEEAVRLERWNTETRRFSLIKDIYSKNDNKFVTFKLEIDNLKRQPENNDIDFWIYMIDRYLRGKYINKIYFGEIQGYTPIYFHVAHMELFS